MKHYSNNNNAYCRAVNAETFQTIEHNPAWIRILLYTRNPYSYSHFDIFICIYSVRGDIDQMSTNTSSYTICSTPNVYIFVCWPAPFMWYAFVTTSTSTTPAWPLWGEGTSLYWHLKTCNCLPPRKPSDKGRGLEHRSSITPQPDQEILLAYFQH